MTSTFTVTPMIEKCHDRHDDSEANMSQVGDHFAYIDKLSNVMHIFKIIKVIQTPDVNSRNLLILSDKLAQISFTIYKVAIGYNPTFQVSKTMSLPWIR